MNKALDQTVRERAMQTCEYCLMPDGITQIGRATVLVLHMNHPEDIAIRIELIAQGRFYSQR
jgi:hypothetical protein